jgi:hypothetical protein
MLQTIEAKQKRYKFQVDATLAKVQSLQELVLKKKQVHTSGFRYTLILTHTRSHPLIGDRGFRRHHGSVARDDGDGLEKHL